VLDRAHQEALVVTGAGELAWSCELEAEAVAAALCVAAVLSGGVVVVVAAAAFDLAAAFGPSAGSLPLAICTAIQPPTTSAPAVETAANFAVKSLVEGRRRARRGSAPDRGRVLLGGVLNSSLMRPMIGRQAEAPVRRR
jgi:hypothetical protein